jgi:hypothetical protein
MKWTVLAAALLVACNGNKDEGTDGPTGTDTGTDTDTDVTDADITDLQVVPGDVPGVMIATFTSSEGVPRVTYGLQGGELSTSTPAGASGTSHEIVILGVKTGQFYDFQAVVETASGEEVSAVVNARVDSADVSVPLFDLNTADESKMCTPGGFILLSHIGANNSGTMIIDRDGDIVWSQPAPPPPADCSDITYHQVSRVRPGPGPADLTYTTADGNRVIQCGTITRQPIDGSAPVVTRTDVSHHDFVMLPDGSYGYLGYEFGPYDECIGGETMESVAVDTIQEQDEGTTSADATVVFSTFDDYAEPIECDIDDESFLSAAGYFDLTHANSLMYRASDDAYFMMWRWHDNLIKIDRATGEKVWELGGIYSDFTPAAGQDPAELFNHSHMSELWDGGALIFNNNDQAVDGPGPSYVQEYALDETNMTWELVWQWNTEGFENLLGDARRMPYTDCDNVLVSLSRSGIVTEITREGEVAWEAGMPIGNVSSRVHFVPDIYDLTSANYPE